MIFLILLLNLSYSQANPNTQAMIIPPDCKECQAALAAGQASILNNQGVYNANNPVKNDNSVTPPNVRTGQ